MLGDCGIGFASVMEDFDFTTPGGKLMLTMIGGVAEFFSDQLGAHVSKTQFHKAQLGLPIGPVPFGYRTLEPGAVPQRHEREPDALLQIFLRRAGGASNGALATWLNDQGFRTLEGGLFTAHAVRDLLDNRSYVGKIVYLGEEFQGQHDPIVSEELFQRVQPQAAPRRRPDCSGTQRLAPGDYFLRQLWPGTPVRPPPLRRAHVPGTTFPSVRYQRQVHHGPCRGPAPAGHSDLGGTPTPVAGGNGSTGHRRQSGTGPKELQVRRRRLARAYADGAFNDTEYEKRLAEIDASLRLTENVELPTLEEAAQLFADIPQLWEEATPEERRKLLDPLIERVYVDLESSLIGAIVPCRLFAGCWTGQ
ncbi:MAG: recombinase family protein [Dehalococcoidia bacterium]